MVMRLTNGHLSGTLDLKCIINTIHYFQKDSQGFSFYNNLKMLKAAPGTSQQFDLFPLKNMFRNPHFLTTM